MTSREFKVEGMSCHHCVKAVEMELNGLELDSKEVTIGLVKVKYDESKVTEQTIIETIEEAGYKVV